MLKARSPQFIVIETALTLCRDLDIVDVDLNSDQATWATGERISLHILTGADSLDKIYELDA